MYGVGKLLSCSTGGAAHQAHRDGHEIVVFVPQAVHRAVQEGEVSRQRGPTIFVADLPMVKAVEALCLLDGNVLGELEGGGFLGTWEEGCVVLWKGSKY